MTRGPDPMLQTQRARVALEAALRGLEETSTSDGRGTRLLDEWELELEAAGELLETALELVERAGTALRLADVDRRTSGARAHRGPADVLSFPGSRRTPKIFRS